jgi:Fe-S cluster assembly iron-binding protein IscA
MRLEEQPGDDDMIVEIRDLRVFVDRDSQGILAGATVDYSDAEDDYGFNFTLAQPVSSCTKSPVEQSCTCERAPSSATPA